MGIPKYRAWSKSFKKIYDVKIINFEKGVFLLGAPLEEDKTYGDIVVHAAEDGRFVPWEDVEVMQWTGLKDKNGKEIYKGDIVKCSSGCPHEILWMDEVPSSAILGGGMPGFYFSEVKGGYAFLGSEEVIGNIYENSNLLTNNS